jgi:hypothetical protein
VRAARRGAQLVSAARIFAIATLVFVASIGSAEAWDTRTSSLEALDEEEWRSLYLDTRAGRNEHAFLADWTLDGMGLADSPIRTDRGLNFTVVDLNASYFRRDVRWNLGTLVNGPGRIPGDEPKTSLQERRLPAPAQFAGLPDVSYTLYDWINRHRLCPPLPPTADRHDDCHDYGLWMGAVFNSSHFGSQASLNYRHYHAIAVRLAKRAADLYRNIESVGPNEVVAWSDYVKEAELEALTYEAIGQHFLQDRWSSGHMWERWNGPDWAALLAPPIRTDPNASAYVGAIAGMIHGHEAVTAALAPGLSRDLLCSPEVVITGDPNNERRELHPMTWRRFPDGEQTFFGVGDFRATDFLEGTYRDVDGAQTYELDVLEQRRELFFCAAQGWTEVIRELPRIDGAYGTLKLQIREGHDLGTERRCWQGWATNRAMLRGLSSGLGIQAYGSASFDIEGPLGKLTGAFLRYEFSRPAEPPSHPVAELLDFLRRFGEGVFEALPSFTPDARDRTRLYWRLLKRARACPTCTDVARNQVVEGLDLPGLGTFEKTPPGNDPRLLHVPDFVEPVDFATLPTAPLADADWTRVDNRPGRDKASVFGFFNRAHTDWWCSEDATLSPRPILDALREVRSNTRDGLNVEVCAYLADRVYRGTDPRYTGARAEEHRYPIGDGTERIVAEPICARYGLVETDGDTDPDVPYYLDPGYVERPHRLARARETNVVGDKIPTHGYDSASNWCRRVPILELSPPMNAEDLVATANPLEDQTLVIAGRDLGDATGVLEVDGSTTLPPWLELVAWRDDALTIRVLETETVGDFELSVTRRAQSARRADLKSVGRFVLRLAPHEGAVVVHAGDVQSTRLPGGTPRTAVAAQFIAGSPFPSECSTTRAGDCTALVCAGEATPPRGEDAGRLTITGGAFDIAVDPGLLGRYSFQDTRRSVFVAGQPLHVDFAGTDTFPAFAADVLPPTPAVELTAPGVNGFSTIVVPPPGDPLPIAWQTAAGHTIDVRVQQLVPQYVSIVCSFDGALGTGVVPAALLDLMTPETHPRGTTTFVATAGRDVTRMPELEDGPRWRVRVRLSDYMWLTGGTLGLVTEQVPMTYLP